MTHSLRGIALFTLLILSACGLPENQRRSSIDDPVNGTLGYVGLVIAHNEKNLVGLGQFWQELLVLDVNQGITHRIRAQASVPRSARLYLGALPPGQYRLASLYSFVELSSAAHFDMEYRFPERAYAFEVKAGELTNLGAMRYESSSGFGEVRFYTAVLGNELRSEDYTYPAVIQFSPNELPYSYFQRLHQFNGPVHNTYFNNTALLIHHRSPEMQQAQHTAHGQSLIYGYFGQAIYRDDNSAWQLLQAPTLNALTAAASLDSQTLIFGDEYGALYLYHQATQEWSQLAIELALEPILLIDAIDENNLLIAQHAAEHASIQRIDLQQKNAQEITRFESTYDRSSRRSNQQALAWVSQRDNSHHRYFISDRFWEYTLSNQDFHPFEHTAQYFPAVLQGNDLIHAKAESFFAAPCALSADFGRNWSNPARGSKVQDHQQCLSYVAKNGLLLRATPDTNSSPDFPHTTPVQILRSSNYAQSWELLETLPKDCYSLLHELSSDEQIFLYCQRGNLMQSQDFGAHWELVFQYADFQQAL